MKTKSKRTVKGFEQAIARAAHVAKFMGQEGRQVIRFLDIILNQASENDKQYEANKILNKQS